LQTDGSGALLRDCSGRCRCVSTAIRLTTSGSGALLRSCRDDGCVTGVTGAYHGDTACDDRQRCVAARFVVDECVRINGGTACDERLRCVAAAVRCRRVRRRAPPEATKCVSRTRLVVMMSVTGSAFAAAPGRQVPPGQPSACSQHGLDVSETLSSNSNRRARLDDRIQSGMRCRDTVSAGQTLPTRVVAVCTLCIKTHLGCLGADASTEQVRFVVIDGSSGVPEVAS
jgi:hypothetical protein